mgnify:FL=1
MANLEIVNRFCNEVWSLHRGAENYDAIEQKMVNNFMEKTSILEKNIACVLFEHIISDDDCRIYSLWEEGINWLENRFPYKILFDEQDEDRNVTAELEKNYDFVFHRVVSHV